MRAPAGPFLMQCPGLQRKFFTGAIARGASRRRQREFALDDHDMRREVMRMLGIGALGFPLHITNVGAA